MYDIDKILEDAKDIGIEAVKVESGNEGGLYYKNENGIVKWNVEQEFFGRNA